MSDILGPPSEGVTTPPACHAANRLAAVNALHNRRPHRAGDFVAYGQSEFPDLCDHCRTRWPCETARAAGNEDALPIDGVALYLDLLESMSPSAKVQVAIDKIRAERGEA